MPATMVISGAGRRWVLIAMTGAISMVKLDQTVVTVALPAMARDLALTPAGQQWVVNAYVLAMASLVALGGKLGDRCGSVTTFRCGVTLFVLASVFCGMAPSGQWGQGWLVAGRALQGVGAALMMPASAAIVIGAFPVSERGRAMAAYAGISQIFLAIGPLVGGAVTELVSWRWAFWLNVPVGVATLAMVAFARPVSESDRTVTIRAVSAVQLVLGLGMVVVAIQQAAVWGWSSPLTLAVLAAGVLLTIWFVVAQLRTSRPLLQVRLFGRSDFLGNVLVLGLVQFGILPVILYCTLYLQGPLEMTPTQCGLALLPFIVALAMTAQVGGRWYDRSGVRPPALTGLALAIVGLSGLAGALSGRHYLFLLPFLMITGLGLGLLMSPTSTDALSRVPGAQRSQASGLVQTVRQLSSSFGIAAVGALVSAWLGEGSPAAPSAGATAVGFVCCALAFVLAGVLGWFLLPRRRVAEVDPPTTRGGHRDPARDRR